MPKNDRGQTLINKYVWVIETIYRARKISFKELLWNGEDVEVLEPKELREEIAERIETMWKNYHGERNIIVNGK